jgi:hypothetical protein
MKANTIRLTLFLALAPLLSMAGDNKSCNCTLDDRHNFCLTVNGSQDIPDSLTYVREHQESARKDTLGSYSFAPCFSESPGKQRVSVYRHGKRVYRSKWVTVGVVDCCHGENKMVDLRLK